MKWGLLVVMTMAVGSGCGRHEAGPGSTFFVPRPALAALGDAVKVVGTHDSGLLVQAVPGEEETLAAAPGGFRFDHWETERSAYGFQSMEARLKRLAEQYPELTTLERYGTSREGRPEYVLTVEKKALKHLVRPELLITSATHGNEVITVDVTLGLIGKLLDGYGKDQRMTDMVDKHILHFIPAVCVDSYVAETRENEGRDPNRDYPYPRVEDRSPVGAISDVMAYFNSKDIVGSLDYHSAASMVMFPWAYTYEHIPADDYRQLDDLTTRMARSNGFAHGDIASTIYVAPGSSADYYYWKHHTLATAVEVSHNYAAAGRHMDDIVDENTESTWVFIENF